MLLKKLTQEAGVSGNENKIRDIIISEIKDYVDTIKTDVLGNLIVFKKGTNVNHNNIMLSAHMDEVGFIVKSITDKGFIKFDAVGGIDSRILLSKNVLVGENKIKGVIGYKAIHLQKKEERKTPVRIKDMYIDIGASDKKDAEKKVETGDYIIFDSQYIEFGNGLVKAKALDDRVGCDIIIQILKKSYPANIYAAFTVQEEVGLRGGQAAAYNINPDMAVVVEGTTCSDVSDVKEHEYVTALGKGPAVSIMDRVTYSDKKLTKYLYDTARENKLPVQYKRGTFGGNDAGKIHLTKEGIPTCSISVPCRYIHSPVSVMSLNDYNNTIKLLDIFLNKLD